MAALCALAGEWLTQLDSSADWMNEMTAKTISEGATGQGRDVLVLGALTQPPSINGLAQAAEQGECAIRLKRAVRDPAARPDPERLKRADMVLSTAALGEDTDRAALYGLRALFAWLGGDTGTARELASDSAAIDASDESHLSAALVAFAVTHDLAPAWDRRVAHA